MLLEDIFIWVGGITLIALTFLLLIFTVCEIWDRIWRRTKLNKILLKLIISHQKEIQEMYKKEFKEK
jgi:hypothetical protein